MGVVEGFITWHIREKQRLIATNSKICADYFSVRKQFAAWRDQQSGLIAQHEEAGHAWNEKRITWEKADQVNQETISTLQDTNQSLQQLLHNRDTQIHELDQRYLQTASRLEDLQESLRVERDRFDKAIDHEREVEEGQRYRLGQVPGSRVEADGKSPLQTRRPPWGEVARKAEAKSRKSPVKEVEQTEQHWKDKIAEVEKKDLEAEKAKE